MERYFPPDHNHSMVIHAIERDSPRKLYWRYAFRMADYLAIFQWCKFSASTLYDNVVFCKWNSFVKIKFGYLLVPEERNEITHGRPSTI